jgi:hypothetical protein
MVLVDGKEGQEVLRLIGKMSGYVMTDNPVEILRILSANGNAMIHLSAPVPSVLSDIIRQYAVRHRKIVVPDSNSGEWFKAEISRTDSGLCIVCSEPEYFQVSKEQGLLSSIGPVFRFKE